MDFSGVGDLPAQSANDNPCSTSGYKALCVNLGRVLQRRDEF